MSKKKKETSVAAEVNFELVRTLEEALKLAKAGDLRAAVIVGVRNDGQGYYSYSVVNLMETIGQLEYLKGHFVEQVAKR